MKKLIVVALLVALFVNGVAFAADTSLLKEFAQVWNDTYSDADVDTTAAYFESSNIFCLEIKVSSFTYEEWMMYTAIEKAEVKTSFDKYATYVADAVEKLGFKDTITIATFKLPGDVSVLVKVNDIYI